MTFVRSIALAGVLAIGTVSGANAAITISAWIVPDAPGGTCANTPFDLIVLGSGGAPGVVGSASSPIVVSGMTITFSPNSGVYVGDVSGVTRSPLRNADGSASNEWYLNARANSGFIDIVLDAPATVFKLLWGSVDLNSPANYNLVTIGVGGDTVTGGQVIAAAGGAPPVVPGTSNIAVVLTSDTPLTTLRFTATQEAFEFLPAVPVPEPASLALLGAGLLGLGFAARRRRSA